MTHSQEKVTALEQELSYTKKELSALYKLGKSAASGYLEHLLSCIVNLTDELIQCDICSIMFLDPKNNTLVVRATQSLDEEFLKQNPVRVDQSLSGLALLEGRSLQWANITQEPLFRYQSMAKRLGLRSLLSIPIMVKSKPIGVVNFYTTKVRHFSMEEIQFLEAIANQAAIAIERLDLFREAQASRRALEERKLIEQAKGILMEKKRFSEKKAYELLRKASMSSRKSIAELAKAIILTEVI